MILLNTACVRRKLGCGFLFAFHSNCGSLLHRFLDKARILVDRIRACDGQTDILPQHSPRYAYVSRGTNQVISAERLV